MALPPNVVGGLELIGGPPLTVYGVVVIQCHQCKMVRVNAPTILASMVDLLPFRYWTFSQFIGHPMRHEHPANPWTLRDANSAITKLPGDVPYPAVAPRGQDNDLCLEAFSEGTGGTCHAQQFESTGRVSQ
jgi:hypothetical protein